MNATLRSCGEMGFMRRSLNRTSPLDGVSSPAMMRQRVVLPAPEGPVTPRISPGPISRLSSSRASVSPNLFDRSLNDIRPMLFPLVNLPSRVLRTPLQSGFPCRGKEVQARSAVKKVKSLFWKRQRDRFIFPARNFFRRFHGDQVSYQDSLGAAFP